MASRGITKELYEDKDKDKEYKRLLDDVFTKIRASEQVDNSFYVTAKYILELVKNSGLLFEKAEKEERQILINTVLTNIRYDGKKLGYDYIEPFNLFADFSKLQNGVAMYIAYEHVSKISIKSLNKIRESLKALDSIISDNLSGKNIKVFTYKL